jgi:release factor glutamine methyltransferase
VDLEDWQIRYLCRKLLCSAEDLEKHAKFADIMRQMTQGKPLSKIFSEKYFWKDCFFTNKYTLDPRPDSELLIQAITERYDKNSQLKILDLGTGTGALGLSLLREFPKWQAVMIDCSPDALEVAKKNAKLLKLSDRCTFRQNNWLTNIHEKFDLLVSNPPYILRDEKINQGAAFDPEISLFCPKPLHFYKPIAEKIKNFEAVFLEINPKYIEKYLELFGKQTIVLRDLSNKTRVIIPKKHIYPEI